MASVSVFLTWFKYQLQVIDSWQLKKRLRHRHLRKRELEKLLRQVFGFSKNRAVYWARFVP